MLPREIHSVKALNASADLFAGNPATDVVFLKDYRVALFTMHLSAGATGTATVTVESCDNATPSTTTAIPFKYRVCTNNDGADTWGAWTDATASGFATTAGTNKSYEVAVEATDLGDDPACRVQLTEVVDSPVTGSVACTLLGARYPQEIPVTALA